MFISDLSHIETVSANNVEGGLTISMAGSRAVAVGVFANTRTSASTGGADTRRGDFTYARTSGSASAFLGGAESTSFAGSLAV